MTRDFRSPFGRSLVTVDLSVASEGGGHYRRRSRNARGAVRRQLSMGSLLLHEVLRQRGMRANVVADPTFSMLGDHQLGAAEKPFVSIALKCIEC